MSSFPNAFHLKISIWSVQILAIAFLKVTINPYFWDKYQPNSCICTTSDSGGDGVPWHSWAATQMLEVAVTLRFVADELYAYSHVLIHNSNKTHHFQQMLGGDGLFFSSCKGWLWRTEVTHHCLLPGPPTVLLYPQFCPLWLLYISVKENRSVQNKSIRSH